MKYITQAMGENWYLIGTNELSLMLLGGVILVFLGGATVHMILRTSQKKKEYMNTLTPSEYKKYREHLDSL